MDSLVTTLDSEANGANLRIRIFGSSTSPMPIPIRDLLKNARIVESVEYHQWRLQLVRTRLKIAAYFLIAGNLAFAALDLIAYRPVAMQLLALRAPMTVIAILGVLLNHVLTTQRRQTVAWIVMVWGTCFPICVMTAMTEGFRSPYYAGMILVLVGFAVLVPVRWRLHALYQLGVLVAYWLANLFSGPGDMVAALINSYMLFWISALGSASVLLYERLLCNDFNVRRQLESSNEKLRELDRLKSQFFANISHELRTPLTLVIGTLRSIAKSIPSAGGAAAVNSGLRNAVRLLYLINELLDLSRFESGRTQLRTRPLDLSRLARQIASNFEHSVRQRIHLHGVGEHLVINGDPTPLKKMIYNLLSNAVKFSDPETGEVWVRLRANGTRIELEVEDNGVGIAAENLTRIFDRFMQVDSTATRRHEGSGIGLALVKEIVHEHGGSVRADSNLGQGSTFYISFPRCEGPPAGDAMEEDELLLPSLSSSEKGAVNSASPFSNGKPSILVADDNPDMRQYLEQILSPHFKVSIAHNGQHAFEITRAQLPDIVLSDIMMPQVSGIDLLAKIRELNELKHVPVVFLSALTTTEARLSALETGVDDIISKPFDEEELVIRLRNILAARQQQRRISEVRLNALRRFLPAPVAAALLEKQSDAALQSHRAEVTVLFFDLRGFTSFAEEAAPEELMDVLRDYQRKIGQLVDKYGGTLERFTGDSIMVFFNDPLPVPDHPRRAIEMAIAARELLPSLENDWHKRGFSMGVGIGAATGYATLGMVGYEQRQDYAAIGPVTNLAARLCARAEANQILIPERYANMLGNDVTCIPLGPVRLKGFKTPVNIYNISAIREA